MSIFISELRFFGVLCLILLRCLALAASNSSDSNLVADSNSFISELVKRIEPELPQLFREGFRRAEEKFEKEGSAFSMEERRSGVASHMVHQHSHYSKNRVSMEASNAAMCRGQGILETSKLIAKKFDIPKEHVQRALKSIPIPEALSQMKTKFCPSSRSELEKKEITCNTNAKFRTITGVCNNLTPGKENYGASLTLLQRFIDPEYGDNVDSLRGEGRPPTTALPNPRVLSCALQQIPDKSPGVRASHMCMAFGQFLDHDIDFSPLVAGSSTCCPKGFNKESTFEECQPIDVAENDCFHATNGGRRCLEFVRSQNGDDGSLGHREQINAKTAFLDASMIYGSTRTEKKGVTLKSFGLLKENPSGEDGSCIPTGSCNRPFLPQVTVSGKTKFVAGDQRVNEQPGLVALHTLFIRYHNKLAKKYKKLVPNAKDNKIYQEVRRIVGAVWQSIIYREYLPLCLGKTIMEKYKLRIKGLDEEAYDKTMNPGIANSFATSAFRFGHSQISETLKGGNGLILLLSEHFDDSNFMTQDPKASPSNIAVGDTEFPSEKVDMKLTDAVVNKLLTDESLNFQHGNDLLAVNTKRGRDHGIPNYNKYREFCGLDKFSDFDDMAGFIRPAAIPVLRDNYKSVDDVDLFIGGISEMRMQTGLVGPTFACIMGKQFQALKFGDRFWIHGSDNPKPFTREQLLLIKNTKLSSVMCSTTTVSRLQKKAMVVVKEGNELQLCSELKAGTVLPKFKKFI